MIVAIDTSTPICRTWLVSHNDTKQYEWQADRGLADGIIKYLRDRLIENDVSWGDITGIVAYKGPGSFTGLRIGLTVLNTIADTKGVAIVGETGEEWLQMGIIRLRNGEDDKLIMPLYGREPNITKPRK